MFRMNLSGLPLNVPSQIHIHIQHRQHRQAGMVPKPTAPAIASGSADAGVAGYLLERQTRRGGFFFLLSVFTPSSAIFCGRKFGNGEKYSCKKKKKVFMNNGTLQIHLVPRHFFFLSFSLQPII